MADWGQFLMGVIAAVILFGLVVWVSELVVEEDEEFVPGTVPVREDVDAIFPEEPQEPIDGEEFCGFSTLGPCESDADCVRSGCSGQACQSVLEERVVTTCEFRACYQSERFGVSCRCVENRCRWA